MKKIWGVVLAIVLSGAMMVCQAEMEKTIPDAGRLKEILADFEDYARKEMTAWRIPGMAVAVVKDDTVVFAKGFGVKEEGGSDPVTPHTVFQIGSATKSFTAALVAMQVDEGKAGWEDRVLDHVPDFKMYDPWVTREFMIEDLLAQHSGLPPYSCDAQAFFGFDRKHIKKSLAFIKPVSSFRSKFAYVNHLFLVAAEVSENATGKTWEDNIREMIFIPLKMSQSSYNRDGLMEGKDVATGHNAQGGRVTPVPKDLNWPYVYGPAGGINSNVMDMTQWLRLHLNDGVVDGVRLVSEENMNFMHTPKTIAGYNVKKERGAYYCQSWVYAEDRPYSSVWHNGGTTGYHSMVIFWPEPKIGMVILTNEASNQLAEALPQYFADLYFSRPVRDHSGEALDAYNKAKAEAAKNTDQRPAVVSPPLAMERYAGIYRNDVYGDVMVTAVSGSLRVVVGPAQFALELRHWDRDTFRYSVPLFGEDADGFVRFTPVADGSVEEMTIDLLEDDGCGVFRRVTDACTG